MHPNSNVTKLKHNLNGMSRGTFSPIDNKKFKCVWNVGDKVGFNKLKQASSLSMHVLSATFQTKTTWVRKWMFWTWMEWNIFRLYWALFNSQINFVSTLKSLRVGNFWYAYICVDFEYPVSACTVQAHTLSALLATATMNLAWLFLLYRCLWQMVEVFVDCF